MSQHDSDKQRLLDEAARPTAQVEGDLSELEGEIEPGNYSSASASDTEDENALYADLATRGAREQPISEESAAGDIADDEEVSGDELDSLDFDAQRDLEQKP